MICICGCSQKKAVRPRHGQLEEDKIDSRKNDKQAADLGTQHRSGSQYSADSANDLSAESELKRSKRITEITMAAPRKDRKIFTFTSGGPSKTFMTDLKTTDFNTVNKKQ